MSGEVGSKTEDEQRPDAAVVASDDHDYIELPDVIGGEEGDFVIQLGAGMEGVAILEGDYVLVRPTSHLDEGALVVAVPRNTAAAVICEVTREADRVLLRSKTTSVAAEAVDVLGKVIGVLRKVS